MNSNEQLLIAIHKNAQMGTNTLDKLKEKCEDASFLSVVNSHYDEYKRIYLASDTLLKNMDGDDKGVPMSAKIMSDMMLEMTSMKDKTTKHFAQMMLKGTERGIEEISDALEQLRSTANPEIINLAEALQTFLLKNKSELLRLVNAN